jgi:hypothetical protein
MVLSNLRTAAGTSSYTVEKAGLPGSNEGQVVEYELDDRFHESNHIGRHHGFLVNPCVAATSLQFSLLSIRFEPSKRPTSRQSRQDVGGKSQGLALRPLRENDFPPDNGGAFHFAIAFRPAAAIRSQLTLMRRRPAIDP